MGICGGIISFIYTTKTMYKWTQYDKNQQGKMTGTKADVNQSIEPLERKRFFIRNLGWIVLSTIIVILFFLVGNTQK
jgi:hypothetical protein